MPKLGRRPISLKPMDGFVDIVGDWASGGYMIYKILNLAAGSLLVASVHGCKAPATQVVSGSDQDLPKLVGGGEGDAIASQRVGQLIVGSGLGLTVDLARTPTAGSANLFACWMVPPATFVLGKAVCATDSARSVEITRAHVELTCSVNGDFGVVPAKQALTLDGCGELEIYAYKFDPPLDLELKPAG